MEGLEQSIRQFEAWQRERSAKRMRIAALLRKAVAEGKEHSEPDAQLLRACGVQKDYVIHARQ